MYWLFDFFFWFKKKKKIIKGSKNWESEVSSEIDLKYFLGEVFGQPNIAFKNNSQQAQNFAPNKR